MKGTIFSVIIFLFVWNICFGNQDLQFLETIHQVGYGTNMKLKTKYPMVEYSPAVTDLLKDGVKKLLMERPVALSYVFSNVSEKCRNDSNTMFQDLKNHTPYAISMFDSDGKPGSGIQHGNFFWLGNVQECKQAQTEKFKGQMCNVVTNLGVPQVIYNIIGVCFPDSCSSKEVEQLVWEALQVVDGTLGVLIYPILIDCPAPLPYSNADFFAITLCTIIVLAAVIGTSADIFLFRERKDTEEIRVRSENVPNYTNIGAGNVNEATERLGLLSNVPKNDVVYADNQRSWYDYLGIVKPILLSFSVITNTRKLLNTSTASGSLTAVNGLRVLSMFWVILGHSYGLTYTAMDNFMDFIQILERFSFQCILNGTFSVDTFFFMSGLLVGYTVLKKLKNQERVNWFMFYFHRFWRLTPVYAFFILIWTTLYKHMIWEGAYAISQKTGETSAFEWCEKYWWTNLLYINNFWPSYGNYEKQCMGWGWYLANDMQFYILSPIFLYLLHRNKLIGIGLLSSGILGCVLSRIITADYFGYKLPGGEAQPTKHINETWAKSNPLYNKPYTRIAPYLVGIWLAYIIVINSNRIRLGKIKLLIGWAIAITTGVSVVYGLYGYYKDINHVTPGGTVESLVYIGLNRFAWSVAVAWVIFVCAVGHGGPVNALLSWKVWAPLGRLTYCAYIVHPAVLFYYKFTFETPLHFTDFTLIRLFLSVLVISYGVSFILSVLVEAPLLALEKVLFRRWIR